MENKKWGWVNIRLTQDEKRRLKEAADRENRTVSNYLRLLIQQAMEAK